MFFRFASSWISVSTVFLALGFEVLGMVSVLPLVLARRSAIAASRIEATQFEDELPSIGALDSASQIDVPQQKVAIHTTLQFYRIPGMNFHVGGRLRCPSEHEA